MHFQRGGTQLIQRLANVLPKVFPPSRTLCIIYSCYAFRSAPVKRQYARNWQGQQTTESGDLFGRSLARSVSTITAMSSVGWRERRSCEIRSMMRKHTYYEILALLCVALLLIPFRSSHAQDCDSIRMVMPQNNRGGTFYLAPQMDEDTERYPRDGYLPVGTLLTLTEPGKPAGTRSPNECDGNERFSLCFNDSRNTLTPYLRFTASNGATGWVAQRDALSLEDWLIEGTARAECPNGSRLLIPIGTTNTHAMRIYRIDHRDGLEYRSTNPVKTVTRSAPWPIMLDLSGNGDKYLRLPEHKDGDSLVRFLRVVWSEPLKEGGFRERTDTVVAATGERDRIFTVVSVPEKDTAYSAFVEEDDSFSDGILNAIIEYVAQLDRNTLRTELQERCRQQPLRVGFHLPPAASNFLPFNVSGEYLELEPFKSYEVQRVTGVVGGTDGAINVFKVKTCSAGFAGPLTTYQTETISFLIENRSPLSFRQDNLLTKLESQFELPLASGVQRNREYMLKLLPERPGHNDPFTAYRNLHIALDEDLQHIDIPDEEKHRLMFFIARTIVDPVH